jgi:hypothetical protein
MVKAATQCSRCHQQSRGRAAVPLTSAAIRPAHIPFHGGTLALGVHDAYFLARYKALRQQMFDCHPDRRPQTHVGVDQGRLRVLQPSTTRRGWSGFRPQATGAFRLAAQLLAAWLVTEDAWYAAIGWEAPPVSRPRVPTTRPPRAPRQLLREKASA